MDPCPLDNTKRSRSAQDGSEGLWRKCLPHSATAISAIPMGAPGWPEFACWTASMDKMRIALAMRVSGADVGLISIVTQVMASARRNRGRASLAPVHKTPDFTICTLFHFRRAAHLRSTLTGNKRTVGHI